jgi:transposase
MVRIGEDRTERLDVIPARYQVIVTVRLRYACPKGRAGVTQARAPAHLLEGSWPTEALLAQIAVAKHSEHMPLNRQAVVMARHGVPIDRSVLADWMGRTGALIAPVVERMAVLLKTGQHPPLRRRDHGAGAGSGARQDEDRLSLGRAARRSRLGRPGTARRRIPLPRGPRRRLCR